MDQELLTPARYREVARALMQSIDEGRYRVREALPAERALSEDFEVSRDTMRKAIKLLESRGYLVSRQGLGTFVAPEALRGMRRLIEGLTDEARRTGRKAGQQVLFLGVVGAPLSVARSLDLPAGGAVARLHRVRYLDDNPMGVQDSYLAVEDPSRVTLERLAEAGSLYRLLELEFGLTLTDAAESLGAVAATAEDAAWLELEPGAPLLKIERLTMADDLRPVEFCVMRYTPGYSYDTVVSRRTGG